MSDVHFDTIPNFPNLFKKNLIMGKALLQPIYIIKLGKLGKLGILCIMSGIK